MADEIIKIKIVPEKYRHYIGEVEITIDEQEIKDYGFITAYKNTLKTMLERVKNNGFHMAVGTYARANTDYNKINSVPILWRDKNNKLDYDAREKDLTLWFSESLKIEIERYKTGLARIPQERQTPYI